MAIACSAESAWINFAPRIVKFLDTLKTFDICATVRQVSRKGKQLKSPNADFGDVSSSAHVEIVVSEQLQRYELLPETGGANYATTRNRALAVGKRIEQEIREEIDHPRVFPEPAERMVVGIDGAFIKAGHTRTGQRHQFEILTGRVETSQWGRRGIRRGAGPGSSGTDDWTGILGIIQ